MPFLSFQIIPSPACRGVHPAWSVQGWWERLARMADVAARRHVSRVDREECGYLHEALDAEQMEPHRTAHYLATGEEAQAYMQPGTRAPRTSLHACAG